MGCASSSSASVDVPDRRHHHPGFDVVTTTPLTTDRRSSTDWDTLSRLEAGAVGPDPKNGYVLKTPAAANDAATTPAAVGSPLSMSEVMLGDLLDAPAPEGLGEDMPRPRRPSNAVEPAGGLAHHHRLKVIGDVALLPHPVQRRRGAQCRRKSMRRHAQPNRASAVATDFVSSAPTGSSPTARRW